MTDLKKQKVTIYFRGMLGYSKVEARAWDVRFGKYAQYSNASFVKFLQPRKRKARCIGDRGDAKVVVLKGWGHPSPDDPFTSPEVTETGCIVRKSRYSSFAPEFDTEFDTWLEQYLELGAEVLLDNRKLNAYATPQTPERITDYPDVNPY